MGLDYTFGVCFVGLCVALSLSLFRMFKGPSPVDRVLSLDLASVIVAGMITVLSAWHDREEFLDVVLVLTIIAFLGTVMFARYIEGRIE